MNGAQKDYTNKKPFKNGFIFEVLIDEDVEGPSYIFLLVRQAGFHALIASVTFSLVSVAMKM